MEFLLGMPHHHLASGRREQIVEALHLQGLLAARAEAGGGKKRGRKAPAKKVEFKLVNCFGHENKVITERVDQWDWNGSGTWQMALKVCGMFELTENGKIIEWREDDIRPCVGAGYCIVRIYQGGEALCLQQSAE